MEEERPGAVTLELFKACLSVPAKSESWLLYNNYGMIFKEALEQLVQTSSYKLDKCIGSAE